MEPRKSFVRTPFTWLAYGMLAYCVYFQALTGLLMPFLRVKLNLNYSLGALHISAFAVGAILLGSIGHRLLLICGRNRFFWGGGGAIALGSLGLTLGTFMSMTIMSTFVMGLGASCALIALQAGLSDQHGEQRTIALAEANIAASITATLAPFVVSFFVQLELGWQYASLVVVVLFILIYMKYGHVTVPTPLHQPEPTAQHHASLPSSYWLCWLLIFIGIASEWCMVAWSNDFLVQTIGLNATHAATMISIFFLAMLIGRIACGCLVRFCVNSHLLFATAILSLAGFMAFWLSSITVLSLAGLFLTGLGIANFFPLAMAIALDIAPDQIERVNARVVQGVGLAILTMPLAMGWTADLLSIQKAYVVVAIMLACSIGLAYKVNDVRKIEATDRPSIARLKRHMHSRIRPPHPGIGT